MDMKDMRSLALLADHGSIQTVAAISGLTSGAVHQHLKSIETEIGLRVYSKSDGKLALTEVGRLLLPFAIGILAEHEAAGAAVREWKDATRGLVRVGAGPSFNTYLLPTLVKRYRRIHSGIELYIETGTSGHLVDRLRAGALDLVFDLAPSTTDDRFKQVATWTSQATFVGSVKMCPPRARLSALEKLPFILFQKGSRMESLVQAYLDQWNFQPKLVMRSDSAEAIKAMIRAGLGISVVLTWNINADLRNKALTVIRTEAPPLILRMALLKNKSSYTPGAVQHFIDLSRKMNWQNLHPEPRIGSDPR
jgi:DNA-binding transcriptional LysR family regulator